MMASRNALERARRCVTALFDDEGRYRAGWEVRVMRY
jgi:hypothetical protein